MLLFSRHFIICIKYVSEDKWIILTHNFSVLHENFSLDMTLKMSYAIVVTMCMGRYYSLLHSDVY